MQNRKPIYLLAGGRGSSNQALFKSVFREIGKIRPVIAYVGAANEDDKRFFGFMGAEIQGTTDCTLTLVLLASKKS